MKVSISKYGVIAVAVFSLTINACSIRKSLPIEGPLNLSTSGKAGEKIFMEHCQRCHPQGEGGLGPAVNPAPSFAKKFQIRHGLGAMPAFNEERISDTELDQVVAYLKALKKNS